MKESLNIIEQALNLLIICNKNNDYQYIIDDFKIVPSSRGYIKNFMESLIYHFKLYTEGIIIPK